MKADSGPILGSSCREIFIVAILAILLFVAPPRPTRGDYGQRALDACSRDASSYWCRHWTSMWRNTK